MKAVFISFDQAHSEAVLQILDRNGMRGYTSWDLVQGRGSKTGEPHLGNHAWPSTNSSIMTMVDDTKVDRLLDLLHKLDQSKPALGLRAFVMNVEKSI